MTRLPRNVAKLPADDRPVAQFVGHRPQLIAQRGSYGIPETFTGHAQRAVLARAVPVLRVGGLLLLAVATFAGKLFLHRVPIRCALVLVIGWFAYGTLWTHDPTVLWAFPALLLLAVATVVSVVTGRWSQ